MDFFAKQQIQIRSFHIQFTKLEKNPNKTMSPELQRIRIAEACGWETNKRKWLAKPPSNSWQYLDTIPDYLNDLNAMHDAEKLLSSLPPINICGVCMTDPREVYEAYLCGINSNAIHATAAQRAEAFLRALNLWEES